MIKVQRYGNGANQSVQLHGGLLLHLERFITADIDIVTVIRIGYDTHGHLMVGASIGNMELKVGSCRIVFK